MTFQTTPFIPNQNDGNNIFVFGSNLAGRHGKGAALQALKHWGAKPGIGIGFEGQSYAIPTKDFDITTRPIIEIHNEVERFLEYANRRANCAFLITAIGTGLAGFTHEQIAPMFKNASSNCVFQSEWEPYLT